MSLHFEQEDIINLLLGVEIAINNRSLTKEQASKVFPSWNKIAAELEKFKRQQVFEKLYSEIPVPNVTQEPVPAPAPGQ